MDIIKRPRGRPRKNPLPIVVVESDEIIVCPKCKLDDPGDWTQCNGSCPMPESPHFINAAKANLPLTVDGVYTLVGFTWTILKLDEHFLKATRSPYGVIHYLARSDFENWITNS